MKKPATTKSETALIAQDAHVNVPLPAVGGSYRAEADGSLTQTSPPTKSPDEVLYERFSKGE